MDNDDIYSRLIDIDELAHALGVSVSTVRRMMRERRIPVIRLRRSIRFDLAMVRLSLARNAKGK